MIGNSDSSCARLFIQQKYKNLAKYKLQLCVLCCIYIHIYIYIYMFVFIYNNASRKIQIGFRIRYIFTSSLSYFVCDLACTTILCIVVCITKVYTVRMLLVFWRASNVGAGFTCWVVCQRHILYEERGRKRKKKKRRGRDFILPFGVWMDLYSDVSLYTKNVIQLPVANDFWWILHKEIYS
jgi:hypothetical protein